MQILVIWLFASKSGHYQESKSILFCWISSISNRFFLCNYWFNMIKQVLYWKLEKFGVSFIRIVNRFCSFLTFSVVQRVQLCYKVWFISILNLEFVCSNSLYFSVGDKTEQLLLLQKSNAEQLCFVSHGFWNWKCGSPKHPNCTISCFLFCFITRKKFFLFLRSYQPKLLHETLKRQILNCRSSVATKLKHFCLCIGILLTQICQKTAEDFDI